MNGKDLGSACAALQTLVGEGADLEATDAAIAMLPTEQRLVLVARLDRRIAELQARTATNTGLPCPDCGTKQQRILIENQNDGSLFVRIAWPIPADKRVSEVKAMCRFLKSFVGREGL